MRIMHPKIGRRRAILLTGGKYTNRNGRKYTCIRRDNEDYVVKSENGWCFRVRHVWLYDDNTVEWDYCSAGWKEA